MSTSGKHLFHHPSMINTFVPKIYFAAQMILVDKLKNKFFRIPSDLIVIDVILIFFQISLWNDLSGLGLQDKAVLLGMIGLCCFVIFLLPGTLTLGYFLSCCYWGGVIAAGLLNHSINLFPVCIHYSQLLLIGGILQIVSH